MFARLPRSIQHYEERAAPFPAWLFRVARNAALDELRRRRAVPSEEPHPPGAVADDPRAESVAALVEALRGLPEEQRRVLLLRHLAGLAPAEIAARLGKSTDAVHCLHHRGRDSARAALTRLGSAPSTTGRGG